MDKKNLFRENPSSELDQKIWNQAQTRLSIQSRDRRFVLRWVWNSSLALAGFWVAANWIRIRKPDPYADLNAVALEMFMDEEVSMIEEADFDYEKDVELLENLDLLEEWQEDET